MANRYLRVYECPENLYCEGVPIVICAGALTKDNVNGKVLVQLRMKNIGNTTIKAVTVYIYPKDTAGRMINTKTKFQYLDLKICRNQEWGAQTPIYLEDNNTRAFDVSIEEIVFSDNTIFKGNGNLCSPLRKPQKLNDYFHDFELEKQFCIETGIDAKILPFKQQDIWFCACGNLNRSDETHCYVCHKNISVLLNTLDIKSLTNAKNERLEKELKIQEAKLVESIKKKKKRNLMLTALLLAFVVIGIVFVVTTQYIIPQNKYNQAYAQMENGELELAINGFAEIPGFKDSDDMVSWKVYQTRANELCEAGCYAEALELFECIDSKYTSEDTIDKIKYCKYNIGLSMIESRKHEEAIQLFEEIKGYKDSQEQIYKCYYEIGMKKQGIVERDAIEAFQKSNSYLDADERILECKYHLVSTKIKEFQSLDDDTRQLYKSYAQELKTHGYKDSDKLYQAIISWKLNIKISSSRVEDISWSWLVNIDKFDSDDKFLNLRIEWSFPEQKTLIYKIYDSKDGYENTSANALSRGYDWWDSKNGYTIFKFDKFEYGFYGTTDCPNPMQKSSRKTGTATLKVYNMDTNELLDSKEQEVFYY